MLDLNGGGAAAQPAGDLIKDATEATFMADVIEASKEVPVLVDFWAAWCGPCKQLAPALEKAVLEAKGKVKLVKVDVDANQMIAGQLRVQSLPTVMAFIDGQPVDGFMGALPPAQIKQFIDQVVAMGGDGGQAEAIAAALDASEAALAQHAPAEAMQGFAQVLGVDPGNARALAGLVKCYVAAGEFEQAKELLESLDDDILADPAIEGAKSALALAEESAGLSGELSDLQARVASDPADLQARYDLALALAGTGQKQEAVDALLEVFRRDREWNEEAAKIQLFKFFDAWGPKDEATKSGRRRLSSLIYS